MKLKSFAKNNVVMLASFFAAMITAFFVPPDNAYAEYFDIKTLVCLFTVLAVVCALREVNFFYILACRLVRLFKTSRLCILALVYISFLGSMLITNDTALLTFLPLGYLVLSTTNMKKHLPFTFIMMNMAANLGGMLTPFGNPQNLYLYTKFNIPTAEFISIMLPPFAVSVALITLCCVFIKPEEMTVSGERVQIKKSETALYLALFLLAVLSVVRIVPYAIGAVIIFTVLLCVNRTALKSVDYSLLLTFVFFFVFAGNMARIDAVQSFFISLMDKDTLLYSALLCQIISNVPAAILLSQFTQNYAQLLVGVNIGGAGTLIASLASLITFNEYNRREPHGAGKFIAKFSAYNFAFLAVLLIVSELIK